MENLFEKLMDQIKMPPNLRRSRQFEHADIENVEVHTASKLWHFQLIFDEILPINYCNIFGCFQKFICFYCIIHTF